MPIDQREADWNAATIADFRGHGGQLTLGPLAGSRLLLLTTTGAVSGAPQTAPLGYTMDGERYVVVGSNSGASVNPARLRNLLTQPDVTLEVVESTFPARATLEHGQERRRLLDAHIAAIPIFARYEGMTERELPVVSFERLS